MKRSKVLVIEDNDDTRKFLEHALSRSYEVISSENAILGIEQARNSAPNIILLDIMLPHLNGLDACKMLKQDERTKNIPIIFLTAKTSVKDITKGLKIGGDDYITKPFDLNVLLARVEARLRSTQSNAQKVEAVIVGDLKIDIPNRSVSFKDKVYSLTLTEFDILRKLASNPGETVSRKEIIEMVRAGSQKQINDRTIDVHVRSIRKKIPEITRNLTSVYGVGYRYEL